MTCFCRIAACVLLSGPVQAGPAKLPAAKPKPPTTLSARIAEAVAGFQARTAADVGVRVIRLADGEELCGIESTRPLIPASNQKIVTSAVALKRLGEGFRFRTVVAMEGDDLVVIGDGDPTTGDPRLAARRGGSIYGEMDRWARALQAAGVGRIKGDVIVRTGVFQPPFTHPDWPARERRKWYAAGVAGVNFNDNCIDVSFTLGGGAVRATVSPASRWLSVINRVKPGKRHVWDCRFDPAGTTVTLTGTAGRSTAEPLSVAVPDPPMLFAAVLADRLERGGTGVAGQVRVSVQPSTRAAAAGRRVIAVESTPLADAMGRANKQSLNMMAECLLLRSSAGRGVPATWAGAAAAAKKVLTGDYGLSPDQFHISDGSGLSRANTVSPAVLTSLLRAMADSEAFVRSLPIGGVDGSLRRRLGGDARGRVLAKTGSIAGVSGLSGYVLDRTGRPAVAFSVLTNARTYAKWSSPKGMENRICRLLIAHLDAPVKTYTKKASPPRGRSGKSKGPL